MACRSDADTHYVALDSPTPTPPYTNWTSAATNIQAAVGEAGDGDTVLVTNGYYLLSGEIAVGDAVDIRSVNGARYTTLDGDNACRCVVMTDSGATIEGFTIAQGRGAYGNYVLGALSNCVIRNCYAESVNYPWGAVYLGSAGKLKNCLIYGNSAKCLSPRDSTRGTAGVFSSGGKIVNCTITGNVLLAGRGGGGLQIAIRKGGSIRNCIIWGNLSSDGVNAAAWSGTPLFSYCCMPEVIRVTEHGISTAPQFTDSAAGDYRLAPGSSCVDAGTKESWMSDGTDLDGNPRVLDGDGNGTAAPDVGAYEFFHEGFSSLSITGAPTQHGAPQPLGYGVHTLATGQTVTISVGAVVEVTNGVGYACAGWTGAGSVPAAGTGTSVVFTIKQHSAITWHWELWRTSDADFGDAPSPYPTTRAQAETYHVVLGPTLGLNRDTDTDGQPSADADGDDVNPEGGPDDEDGVQFPSPVSVGQLGAEVVVNVQGASTNALLDAWLDLNRDGTWGGPCEQIAGSRGVTNGDNVVRFDVPGWAASGPTYGRFRLSTAGALGPKGYALDGEMEDHLLEVEPPMSAAGLFGSKQGVGDSALSTAAADIDGDGDMDLVAAMESDEVAWFENDGNQSFARHLISKGSRTAMSVFAADMDGDGDMDVISAHRPGQINGRIAWHENDGSQSFTEHAISTRSYGAWLVVGADMDGDGDMDVCCASDIDSAILWCENDGNEGFLDHVIASGAGGVVSVFVADVDQDGDLDVLSAASSDNEIAWYENDGSQNYVVHVIDRFANGAQSVFAADMDGDGDMDVVSASASEGRIAWHENDGSQTFVAHVLAAKSSNAHAASAADMDGDGDMDIVAAWKEGFYGGGTNRIVWFENDADGEFTEQVISAAEGGYSLGVADVDGDGDLDVIAAWRQGTGVGNVAWYENVLALDFGDLPAAYQMTTLSNSAARHKILRLRLGSAIDNESDGQESSDAGQGSVDGDDGTGTDDEDGVVPVETWTEGQAGGHILVDITGGEGYVSGWIDWNSDNDLGDPGEQVLAMAPVSSGVQLVAFDIPTGAMPTGDSSERFARFRLAADASPPLSTTGLVTNGEVEDYLLPLGGPAAVSLQIVSPHGGPQPSAGRYLHSSGALLTNGVSRLDTCWPTQHISLGWTMTGNEPSAGTNTSMVMTHTNDAVLSWAWKTQFWVSVSAAAGGAATTTSGWRDAGSVVEATAVAGGSYAFSHWSDAMGERATNNPLRVEVDRPRRIAAHFASTPPGPARTHFVDIRSCTPLPPYTNWQTSATVIQDALDVCDSNDLVLVAAGVYSTGGRSVYGSLTNRIAVSNGVSVLAVDGPEMTSLVGAGPVGETAERCAYVGDGAQLSGFTLSGGYTLAAGDFWKERCGGAAWCKPTAVISNCIITGSTASAHGGGVMYGTVLSSTLSSNKAGKFGGAAYACSVSNCIVEDNAAAGGGGLYDSAAVSCRLSRNNATSSDYAYWYGGGAYKGTLDRCTVVSNYATKGSGAAWATVRNSLISGNGRSHSGGGLFYGSAENCTIFGNSGTFGSGTYRTTVRSSIVRGGAGVNDCWEGSVKDSCIGSLYSGTESEGNISTNPLLVDVSNGDYRLRPLSPCVDAGVNRAWMNGAADLAGGSRIVNGTVDIGAYELVFTADIKVWLQGAYDEPKHAMTEALAIPLTSPYASDARTAQRIPSNATDWVLVELGTPNGTTVFSRSAFLRGDGHIVSEDGRAGLQIGVAPDAYTMTIKHRNHLTVQSAAPVAFTNRTVAVDLTTGPGQCLGGSNGVVQVEPGAWAMVAGDADGDGEIRRADQQICDAQANRVGYHRGDFDLDGVVSSGELTVHGIANQGRRSQALTPEVVLSPSLGVVPSRQTMLSGETIEFQVEGSTGTVACAYVQNLSGGSLDLSTLLYQAGTTSSCIDVIEAWDLSNRLGRTYVNVISGEEAALAGKAVLIAGRRGVNDPLWSATDNMIRLGYKTLLYRGFSKANIQYLSAETGQDIDGNGSLDDVDLAATLANIEYTMTNWVLNTDTLFLYLVDHGGDTAGSAYLRLSSSEKLTAAELDAWLDALQDAYQTEVTVVVDCCQAGSFLDELTYNGQARRTVIAACEKGVPTYFAASGFVSFSDTFFSGILLGMDIVSSFELAQSAMETYQCAVLDDTGDGEYEEGVDGTNSAGVTVGATFVAGKDIPQIGQVSGNQALEQSALATLWASDISAAYSIDRVWCVIVPPGHNPDSSDPVQDLAELDLTYNGTSGRYEASYHGFSQQGVYKAIFYARDTWGSVSLPKQSYITQDQFDERAILVAAGETNDANWAAVSTVADLAYHTCVHRWLTPEHIYYLSADTNRDVAGDGTNDVRGRPTLANLAYAVTNWAGSTNWGGPADRLTVHLVGGSTNDALRMNGAECLAAADLNVWLEAMQTHTNSSVPPSANVILDFPGSGGFLPALATTSEVERICVAGSGVGQPAVMGNRGLVSFSGYFFTEIFRGRSIGDAYTRARNVVRRVCTGARQSAVLDDNGDGFATTGDGDVARERYIGTAFVTGEDAPEIGQIRPDAVLVATNSLTLWAGDITDADGISNVWCMVTPPDYDGTGVLQEVGLTWSEEHQRYEAAYAQFRAAGTYVCTYLAEDISGQMSGPTQGMVRTPGAYEANDEPAEATGFDVSGTQLHDFDRPDDEDWAAFCAASDFCYLIETVHHGEDVDTVLEVYREYPYGVVTTRVERADDGGRGLGGGETARLDHPHTGMYYVRVTSAVDWGPDSAYDLTITLEGATNGSLVVVAVDRLCPGHAPSNAVAVIDGEQRKELGTNGTAEFSGLAPGTHRVEVQTAQGYLPEEDPALPDQVADMVSALYGNPKWADVSLDAQRVAVFQFIPVVRARGVVCDGWTGARVEGAQVSFEARSGGIAGQDYRWYPDHATYGNQWSSAADGSFPTNVWLPAVDWDLTLVCTGYLDHARSNAVSGAGRGDEIDLGTLLMVPVDGNSNRIADTWEAHYFMGVASPTNDADGDRHDNRWEYICGTDPTNPNSVLCLTECEEATNGFTVSWPACPERSYRVYCGTNLATGLFTPTSAVMEADSGQTQMQWTDSEATGNVRGFYRVQLVVP